MNFDFKRLFEKRPTLYYTESTDISRKRWSEQMDMENLIGETTEYDKKAALEVRKPKSWCKSVSAFANTLGGALIFGMADDGQIVGLTEPDSDAEKISEILKTRMEPIPEFRLRFHRTEDGKVLLILDVFKGEETPYYYSGDGTLEAFVRIGNESVKASATELKRLVLRGRNTSYDSRILAAHQPVRFRQDPHRIPEASLCEEGIRSQGRIQVLPVGGHPSLYGHL